MAKTMNVGNSSNNVDLNFSGGNISTYNGSVRNSYDNDTQFWFGCGTNDSTEDSVGCRSKDGLIYLVSGSSYLGIYWQAYYNKGYAIASDWLLRMSNDGTLYYSANKTSDKRYKTKISDLSAEEANAVLSNVKPIVFYYNNDEKQIPTTGIYAQDLRDALINNNIGERDYLIVENLKTHKISHSLSTDEEDNVKYSIDYTGLIPTLIKGWQNHEEKISNLEKNNVQLKQRINTIKEYK